MPVFVETACVFLLGLIAGSFLNVVIVRLPLMLDTDRHDLAQEWPERLPQADCRLNLVQPRSHCPACGAPIRFWQNIPLLSFAWQRGRCVACRTAISWQYPLVELAAAALALSCSWRFGITFTGLLAAILAWSLLALAVIDWRTQLLPDSITLPLSWLGLLAAVAGIFTDPASAILGGVTGYGILWLVQQAFRLLTGKQGMGHGDFKLLAALGAWLGWQQLPVIMLIASASGALTGLLLIASGKLERSQPLPFGPFLAMAGWLSLLAGDTMLQNYFALAG